MRLIGFEEPPHLGPAFPHQRCGMREHIDPGIPQDEGPTTAVGQQSHHVPIRMARPQKGESGVIGEDPIRAQHSAYQIRVRRPPGPPLGGSSRMTSGTSP